MILFKCDVCGCECPEKVDSCQPVFGVKNISTDETRRKATMHATELCEGCFMKYYVRNGTKKYDNVQNEDKG